MAHLYVSFSATMRVQVDEPPEYIIPSVFNRDVVPHVARAVADATEEASERGR